LYELSPVTSRSDPKCDERQAMAYTELTMGSLKLCHIYGATERCRQILGMSSTHQNKKKCNMCPEISELQLKVVKMSSIRFNCMYGQISSCTAVSNIGVAVESLTGTYDVIVKSLFVVNRSCIHTQRFAGVPTLKI
jgi:hypothetical protein